MRPNNQPAVWHIVETRAVVEPLVATDAKNDLQGFLEKTARMHQLSYLLAFADDGVIWGRIDAQGRLVTAPRVSPLLRATTLQSARLFGANAEVLLWRDEDTRAFSSRVLRESAHHTLDEHVFTESLDEDWYLWGSQTEQTLDGFTVWREGAQGLRHAVPFPDNRRPPRLRVRHYLAPNEPMARIAVSRLVDLRTDEEAED